MKSIQQILAFSLCLMVLFSCKDKKPNPEPQPEPVSKGQLNIEFENMVGNAPLVLTAAGGTPTWYVNANGDSFTVSKYNYYITNLELIKEDGTSYTNDDLNFLVIQSLQESKEYVFNDIPYGKYTKIRCLLGVDSLHNVSGAQEGVLDPIWGMFWDWNTGYIMAKLEGNSPSSAAPSQYISYHIGGFSGVFSSLKTLEIELPSPIYVGEKEQSILIFKSDVAKWFDGEPPIDFSETYSIMDINKESWEFAQRYHRHLSVKEVHTIVE